MSADSTIPAYFMLFGYKNLDSSRRGGLASWGQVRPDVNLPGHDTLSG